MLFWDGEKLETKHYDGVRKHYVCGKALDKSLLFTKKTKTHLVCIIDAKERIVGLVGEGEHLVLDHDHSGISGKHNQGGQSAGRFERQRNELLKQWYKQTADIMNQKIYAGVDGRIILAGPSRSKLNVKKYLKTEVEVMNAEYCNTAGLIQMRNKL